ncbi:hypothetical protein QCA50_018126 [Cerrena zonata]|uniref:Ribosome maturation protein SDO1/SBDS N-terminal domain-containing protein n=1 Tax=Cerrena zonata TaxID=2478898 RepID=A0AAW0FHN5_9APHY
MAQPHKLFWKGSDYDFVVFIEDSNLVQKYKDIVSIYKVFINRQGGVEGVLDEASKSELANEFGSSDVDSIIKKILVEGTDKKSAGSFHSGESGKNDSMGAGEVAH